MKLLVLFGGPSSEHEVSVDTAKQVFPILKKKHTPELLFIGKDLKCTFLRSFEGYSKGMTGKADFFSCLGEIEKYDLCFLCLHGEFGEDGTIQSIFESKGIRYTGSDSYASRLCMDKYRTMLIIKGIKGIHIPITSFFDNSMNSKDVSFPCVLKPNRDGSSVGVSLVHNLPELKRLVKGLTEPYLIQEYVHGVEVSCPVLQKKDGSFTEIPPIEIRPRKADFFDYKSKYSKGGSEEISPPVSISKSLSQKIVAISIKTHSLLGCSVYSRSDFMVRDGKIYYLETNTLPGMTSTSLLPRSAAAAGIDFPELLEFIINNR